MFDLANQFVQLAQVCRNNKVDFEIKIIINAQKCTTSTFRVPGWKLGRGNSNIIQMEIYSIYIFVIEYVLKAKQ